MLTIPSPHLLAIAAALTLGAGAATAAGTAQDSTSAGTATTTVPATTIGVHPQDAKEALQKASPRADTGTLVRTSESAEKRARELGKDIQDKIPNTTPVSVTAPAKVHSTTATPLPATTPAATPAATRQPQRAASAPHPGDVQGNKTTGTVTNTTTPNAAMGITGTLPGADDTTGDATNTRDNAHKGQGGAAGKSGTRGATDAMGNRTSTPGTSGKP